MTSYWTFDGLSPKRKSKQFLRIWTFEKWVKHDRPGECSPKLARWRQWRIGSPSNNHGDGYYSISLNSSNVGTFFLELNSKRLYRSSGKDKESRCLEFTSSTKRIIMNFLVVVVPWRQRTVQKSAMYVQICCFANLNHFFFCRFRGRRLGRCSSSLLTFR